jgi:RHS repeat-associated protein
VIADAPQAGATTRAAIDSIGDRLCTSTGSGFGWIVADLHGNVAGQTNGSGGSLLDVLRYDAYGKAVGSPGTPSSVPTPWRFQGRILESTSGSDAYDFDARSYLPDLGTFTSLDSVTGSAQNPMTLNRYLYALGNPATLVDPDGHFAGDLDDERGYVIETSSVNTATGFSTGSRRTMDTGKVEKDRAARAVRPVATSSGGGSNATTNRSPANAGTHSNDPDYYCLPSSMGECTWVRKDVDQGGGKTADFGSTLAAVAMIAAVVGCVAAAAVCVSAATIGALSGAGGYGLGVFATNCAKPGCSLDGFDPGQAAMAAFGGMLTGAACAGSAGLGCIVGGATSSGMMYGATPGDHTPGGYALNMFTGGALARLGGATVANKISATIYGSFKGAGVGSLAGWLVERGLEATGQR